MLIGSDNAIYMAMSFKEAWTFLKISGYTTPTVTFMYQHESASTVAFNLKWTSTSSSATSYLIASGTMISGSDIY